MNEFEGFAQGAGTFASMSLESRSSPLAAPPLRAWLIAVVTGDAPSRASLLEPRTVSRLSAVRATSLARYSPDAAVMRATSWSSAVLHPAEKRISSCVKAPARLAWITRTE